MVEECRSSHHQEEERASIHLPDMKYMPQSLTPIPSLLAKPCHFSYHSGNSYQGIKSLMGLILLQPNHFSSEWGSIFHMWTFGGHVILKSQHSTAHPQKLTLIWQCKIHLVHFQRSLQASQFQDYSKLKPKVFEDQDRLTLWASIKLKAI